METKPLISILIPHYNDNDTLRFSVTSAVQQTYPNIEVIVCDDCSTKVPKFNDAMVKVLKNDTNIGCGATNDRLVQEAKGEFFSVLDADDIYFDNEVIEKLYDNMIDVDWVYGDMLVHGEDGKTLTEWKYTQPNPKDIPRIIKARKGSSIVPYNHGLHRKSFWVDNKIKHNMRCAGDTLALIHACERGLRLRHVHMPMTKYNFGDGISSSTLRREGIKVVMDYLEKNYPDFNLDAIAE